MYTASNIAFEQVPGYSKWNRELEYVFIPMADWSSFLRAIDTKAVGGFCYDGRMIMPYSSGQTLETGLATFNHERVHCEMQGDEGEAFLAEFFLTMDAALRANDTAWVKRLLQEYPGISGYSSHVGQFLATLKYLEVYIKKNGVEYVAKNFNLFFADLIDFDITEQKVSLKEQDILFYTFSFFTQAYFSANEKVYRGYCADECALNEIVPIPVVEEVYTSLPTTSFKVYYSGNLNNPTLGCVDTENGDPQTNYMTYDGSGWHYGLVQTMQWEGGGGGAGYAPTGGGYRPMGGGSSTAVVEVDKLFYCDVYNDLTGESSVYPGDISGSIFVSSEYYVEESTYEPKSSITDSYGCASYGQADSLPYSINKPGFLIRLYSTKETAEVGPMPCQP